MIFASKSTLSLNNLVIRPKVKKNLTNLCKKFIGFPPSFLAFFSRKYNYEKSQLFDTILCFVEKRKNMRVKYKFLVNYWFSAKFYSFSFQVSFFKERNIYKCKRIFKDLLTKKYKKRISFLAISLRTVVNPIK